MRIQFARLGALLALLSLVFPLSAQTTTRPIADFVSAQGTFCFPDGMGGCLVFVPPVPNFLGFVDLNMASIFEYPKPGVDPTTGDLDYQSVHTGFALDPDRWGPAVLDFLKRNGVK